MSYSSACFKVFIHNNKQNCNSGNSLPFVYINTAFSKCHSAKLALLQVSLLTVKPGQYLGMHTGFLLAAPGLL